MELRHLKYFATVATTLNFSEASRKLYITQGTLSQQIRQLEFEVGSPLFERSTHKVTLTEAGRELLPLALKTIESSEECLHHMRELRGGLVGTVSIGATRSFSGMLIDTVKTMSRLHPKVRVNLCFKTAPELLEMLRNREIDAAVAFKPNVEYPDVETESLFKTHLGVVMRRDHPLAGSLSLSMTDLKNYPVVMPGKGLRSGRDYDHFAGIDTRGLDVRVEMNDPQLIIDLVQSSNMMTIITPIPSWYRPALVSIPLDGGCHPMTGCVHRLKEGFRSRASEVFLETLHEFASIDRFEKNLEK